MWIERAAWLTVAVDDDGDDDDGDAAVCAAPSAIIVRRFILSKPSTYKFNFQLPLQLHFDQVSIRLVCMSISVIGLDCNHD